MSAVHIHSVHYLGGGESQVTEYEGTREDLIAVGVGTAEMTRRPPHPTSPSRRTWTTTI